MTDFSISIFGLLIIIRNQENIDNKLTIIILIATDIVFHSLCMFPFQPVRLHLYKARIITITLKCIILLTQ